jgi:flagellar biosynthesis protein FliR
MHGELTVPTATLIGFLLTLARISGVFVFVPMPGSQSGVEPARVIMAVAVTIALAPFWPHPNAEATAGQFAVWIVSEAALGIGIGLAVGLVLEAVAVGAQIMGLQAGYAYASTIDPNSNADSSVLVVFAQLASGLIFFSTGMHREVLRTFAASLTVAPAGSFVLAKESAVRVLETAQILFSTGARLALPVIALLIMVDVSLALLGRVNSQLQMLSMAFPVKMMLALTVFGWLLSLLPGILRADFEIAMTAARGLLVR